MSRPMPDGAPGAGATPAPGGAPPSAAPANPLQFMLAQVFQALKRLAQENPTIAAEMAEAGQVLQRAQSKLLVAQPGGPSPDQNPPQ